MMIDARGACTAERSLLPSAELGFDAVDSCGRFFVICDYTGKEVVGCKVQMHIVVPDQVRWLRLRAVALILWGVPDDPWSGKAGTSLANNP
jgi:hypothetical protein